MCNLGCYSKRIYVRDLKRYSWIKHKFNRLCYSTVKFRVHCFVLNILTFPKLWKNKPKQTQPQLTIYKAGFCPIVSNGQNPPKYSGHYNTTNTSSQRSHRKCKNVRTLVISSLFLADRISRLPKQMLINFPGDWTIHQSARCLSSVHTTGDWWVSLVTALHFNSSANKSHVL